MAAIKNKGNRKVLKRLYKKSNGICYYCGCKTCLPVSGYDGIQPISSATIEHLYNKFTLIRLIIKKWAFVELSCRQCNNRKGNADALQHYKGYDYNSNHEGLLIGLLKDKSSLTHWNYGKSNNWEP